MENTQDVVCGARLPEALTPLAEAPRWVGWCLENRGDGTPTKVPVCARAPYRYASTKQEHTWAKLQRARRAVAEGHVEGIGFVLTGYTEAVFLDLDKCRDPETGELESWARALVEACNSYTEVTPSGRGLRIIGLPGMDLLGAAQGVVKREGAGQVEIYFACRRYVTVTGRRLEGTPDVLADIGGVAFDLLAEAAQQREARQGEVAARRAGDAVREDLRGDAIDIEAAAQAMANPDLDWEQWSRLIGAFFNASDGSAEGLEAAGLWSAKSEKHNDEAVWERWQHFERGNRYERVGMQTLVALAREAVPGWRKPSSVREVAAAEEEFDAVPEEARAAGVGPRGGPPLDAPRAAWRVAQDGWFLLKQQSRVVLAQAAHDAQGRRFYRMMKRADVEALYEDQKAAVPHGQGVRMVNPVALWMEWEGRRVAEGLDLFLPGETPPEGWVNLWEGWGVEPEGGWRRCRLLLWHIRHVICGGSRSWFRYVMRWLAKGVQHPNQKIRTALVLRGPEGTGKGTLAKVMQLIYGQHAIHLTQHGQVAGRFNAHLLGKLFAFADEAFFAGDRASEGPLKALITEMTMVIEAKGVDAITVRNRLRLMMATNEDFAVRAGPNARRFALLDVLDRWGADREGRAAYFKALHEEIENGGAAAFLALLMRVDVAGWSEEEMPASAGLVEQKVMSLRGVQAWWMEVLTEGTQPWAEGWDADARGWHRALDKAETYAAYARWAAGQRSEYGALHIAAFWKALARVVTLDARRVVLVGGSRARVVTVPPLADARAQMAAWLRSDPAMLWPEEDDQGAGEDRDGLGRAVTR